MDAVRSGRSSRFGFCFAFFFCYDYEFSGLGPSKKKRGTHLEGGGEVGIELLRPNEDEFSGRPVKGQVVRRWWWQKQSISFRLALSRSAENGANLFFSLSLSLICVER